MNIMNIMKKTIIISLLVLAYVLYYNCWKDHSEKLKELGNYFNENVMDFYKMHQRHPDQNEIVTVLKDSGCKNAKVTDHRVDRDLEGIAYSIEANYSCEYFYFMEIRVQAKFELGATPPISVLDRVDFGKSGTRCVMLIEDKGKSSPMTHCGQRSCFINLGH